VVPFENGPRKDVMELQEVLPPAVRKRNRELRCPIRRLIFTKGEEHRLEISATGIASFKLGRRDVESAKLRCKTLDESFGSLAVANACQILVEQRFRRST